MILNFYFFLIFTLIGNVENPKTETFKVWGNCGMCKKTIEKSLSKKGIEGNWNKKTKLITVTYDSLKFNSQQVHEIICATGYDTEKCRANDEAYNNLHECCQYKRRD
ncbi:MAG: heavy-metal-associated domain-containing protein [Bacteroidetes bacterium]|nr:heavy-metal-associated domain-containing protein [Bacteroidota bacterium]